MFSIILPIYIGTTLSELERCISSITNQIYKEYELLLVQDGPLKSELQNFIDSFNLNKMKLIKLKNNLGPGFARNEAVKFATYELIVIMDSDDYALPDRLSNALKAFLHLDIDIYCTAIQEHDFQNDRSLSIKYGRPFKNARKFEYLISPMNNVSIIIKKSAFLNLGGYPNLKYGEDYVLWAKAILADSKIYYSKSVSVLVDISNGFNSRRFNNFFVREISLIKQLYNIGYYNLYHCIARFTMRIIQIMMPTKLRYCARLYLNKF